MLDKLFEFNGMAFVPYMMERANWVEWAIIAGIISVLFTAANFVSKS